MMLIKKEDEGYEKEFVHEYDVVKYIFMHTFYCVKIRSINQYVLTLLK